MEMAPIIYAEPGFRVIAAKPMTEDDWWSLAILSAIVLGAVLVIAVLLHWYRSRSRRREEDTTAPPFTLQDLRDLRARGELSETEFQQLRAAMLAEAGASASRPEAEPPVEENRPGGG